MDDRLDLELEFLDQAVRNIRSAPLPRFGWIKSVRTAFGMTGAQLAMRVGVSATTIAYYERSEAAGTISLNSLRKIADALHCALVFATAPKSGDTFDRIVQRRAEYVVRRRAERVGHNMKLEDQEVDQDIVEGQMRRAALRLRAGSRRKLWAS
jgi:predicted DNA-binding mobile mystery protein A